MRISTLLLLCFSTQVMAEENWRLTTPPPPKTIVEVSEGLLDCHQQVFSTLSSLKAKKDADLSLKENELSHAVDCLKNGQRHMQLASMYNDNEENLQHFSNRAEVEKLKFVKRLIKIRDTALRTNDDEVLREIDEQLTSILKATNFRANDISLSVDYEFGLKKLREYFNTAPLVSDELKQVSTSYFSTLLDEQS